MVGGDVPAVQPELALWLPRLLLLPGATNIRRVLRPQHNIRIADWGLPCRTDAPTPVTNFCDSVLLEKGRVRKEPRSGRLGA